MFQSVLPSSACTPKVRTPRFCQGYARVTCSFAEPSLPNRRQALLSTLVALPSALVALKGGAVPLRLEIEDASQAKATMNSLDQMRDSEEDQRRRFALQGYDKLSLEEHAARAKESVARLQFDVKDALDKNHVNRVFQDVRHQLGTLRYDLDALTAAKTNKSQRKLAKQMQDKAMLQLEQLDVYARTGKIDKARAMLESAVKALDEVVAFVA